MRGNFQETRSMQRTKQWTAAAVILILLFFAISQAEAKETTSVECPTVTIADTQWRTGYTVNGLRHELYGYPMCNVSGYGDPYALDAYTVATDVAYASVAFPEPGQEVTYWANVDGDTVVLFEMNEPIEIPAGDQRWNVQHMNWRIDSEYTGYLKLIRMDLYLGFIVLPDGTVALVDKPM